MAKIDEKKLAELIKNEDFVAKIMEATTAKEVKDLFKERGMELTDEEAENISKIIIQTIQNYSKLSDKDLENISGGINAVEGIALGVGTTLLIQVALIALIIKKGPDFLGYLLKDSTFRSNRL